MAEQGRIDYDILSKKLPVETEKADGSTSTDIYKKNEEKSFVYRISNKLREPTFDESITLVIVEDQPLLYYVIKAVETDKERFRGFGIKLFYGNSREYTEKYFKGDDKGYTILKLNRVSENYVVDRSYWQIRTQEGKSTVDISHFIPEDGMEVTIELVQEEEMKKCK